MTKLTDVQVKEIRKLFKTKMMKQKDMATKYGTSVSTINNIIGRRTYNHVVDEEIEIDNERPYPCREGCNKCFGNSSNRSAHERGHTKPYKCSVCKAGFAEKDRMRCCERKHRSDEDEKKEVLPDIFTLLDLSGEDVYDETTLRRKYKRAVLKHHPDKGGNESWFIKAQGFKVKLLDLIDDDEMVDHYLDQKKQYTEYKSKKEKYDSQVDLRKQLDDVTKKMNEARHLKGTVDEGFKNLRRQQYAFKQVIVSKPSYWPTEFGESLSLWF